MMWFWWKGITVSYFPPLLEEIIYHLYYYLSFTVNTNKRANWKSPQFFTWLLDQNTLFQRLTFDIKFMLLDTSLLGLEVSLLLV